MKKLVIFLILLIISIPTFAEEKLSFIENFSLAKYSGDNIRKVFEIDIFLDRTHLLGVNAFENRKQNWWDKSNIRYGPQQHLSSEEESESLAEFYLKGLAEGSKKRREIGGTIVLIVGGGLIALGAPMTKESGEGDLSPLLGYPLIITGAVGVVVGAFTLARPSRPERKLKKVISISDPTQRERASHEALSLFAARGRRNRILMLILSTTTVLCEGLVFGESPVTAILALPLAALTVYSFVKKSPSEKAFQDYLKEKESEQRKELALRVGIMPYGGVKISFAFSF